MAGNNRPFSEWVQLENFKCPAARCPSKKPFTWVCARDGNYTYMNALGRMKCSTNAHNGNIISWTWNCGDDFHNGEYLAADLEGFTFALSQAVQLMGKMGSAWVANLITELGKQYGH
ncbi:uncharacterized protein LOC127841969 isoform X3 [Dreissena polymorpha]|uniref:uncharacterized protein LOC127841969 isoform X2 n=1 Tax=Dreissena polymorpha TaxID=45954 RepID=UPI002264BFE6|nr:uncharacterized protein LOC127841969 isoform X2 [Dreissena polymorpha]XP_052227140.1 uncharacterized protein LOC127841969 isoform X3 [Dreissena polymorpha]